MNIGRYEIERELGRGGMAVVYLARDPAVKRRVAVKVLPAELADADFRARFEREVHIIAALDHPNIVTVHDSGDHDGQLYFVMRHMPGGSLRDRLARGPLDLPEIAALLQPVASALDDVHARGLVHRDLKPANILFDSNHRPHLSDFGIARSAGAQSRASGVVIGTPEYMSPEQARGLAEVDRRSDIYSLGVVLFQLLTGRVPYQADNAMGAALAHIVQPVPDLLALRPDLPPAAATILRRALAKNPADRYATAGELARDVRHLAEGRADLIAPLPTAPNLAPATRPQPRRAGLAPLSIGFILLCGITTLLAALAVYSISLNLAPTQSASLGEAAATLQPSATPRSSLAATLTPASIATQTFTPTATSTPLPEPITAANAARLKETDLSLSQDYSIRTIAFSPDGLWMAAGSGGIHEYPYFNGGGGLYVFDSGAFKDSEFAGSDGVNGIAFSPDSTTIATAGHEDGAVRLWDVETGQLIRVLESNVQALTAVVFSTDGRALVAAGLDGDIVEWNVETGERTSARQFSYYVTAVAFSPDGALLADSNTPGGGLVRFWSVADGVGLSKLLSHPSTLIWQIGFSPDGSLIASGDNHGLARVWEVNSGELVYSFAAVGGDTDAHPKVSAVAISPDNATLAVARDNGRLTLYDLATGEQVQDLTVKETVSSLAFSPGGRLLISGDIRGRLAIWSAGP